MTKSRYLAVALLSVVAVGCSDGARAMLPLAPSAVVAPVPALAAEAAGWATSRGWSTMATGRVAVADGIQVEGTEVVDSVSGSCANVTVTLRGVEVQVNASTHFVAPLTCAGLTRGHTVRVVGELAPSGSGFGVRALSLELVGTRDAVRTDPGAGSNRGGERLGGEGVVGAVSGRCPSVVFVISGYRVQANADTVYVNGSCDALREGRAVKLDVERYGDGQIVAERIELLR